MPQRLLLLHKGVYLASNASYNFSRGFFERVESDGSALILLCWVAPGKCKDCSIGSCFDAASSAAGYHSRIARASNTDNTLVLCTEHVDAVHVVAEIYIQGMTYHKTSGPTTTSPAAIGPLGSPGEDANFSLTEEEEQLLLSELEEAGGQPLGRTGHVRTLSDVSSLRENDESCCAGGSHTCVERL